MTDETTYNGWTNYETWCVNLWLDNEQALQEATRDQVLRLSESREIEYDHERVAAFKEWITDMAPDLGASMWSDLLNAALSEVNWDELWDAWLEAAKDAEVAS